jgi:hypothetical protein
MFGKILVIDNNVVTIENISGKAVSNIMNVHLVFEESNRKVIGEVIFVDDKFLKVLLIGEISNDKFSAGVIKKPSGNINIRIINMPELELILGKSTLSKDRLLLGKSPIYSNFNISVALNDFFASHSAIIGNTGSGKSCCVARMLQNLFLLNNDKPRNAHIVLFDAYGEYSKTFDEMNNIGLNFTKYTTKTLNEGEKLIGFPAYFLDVDDLAILLEVTNKDQIPVLSKTLKLVSIFKCNDPKIKEYKNNIVANCLMDILTSGRPSNNIRDQIIAVLTHYGTETLNLDAIIYQPGYKRTLRQCLLIDEHGKMNAIQEVVKFIQQFDKVNLDEVTTDENILYNLEDIYYALEFALISEGNINSDVAYKQNNILKTRLQSIINSDKNNIFKFNNYYSKDVFIKEVFGKSQLININLSYLDDRFAKILTKLFSKLLFTYTTKNYPRGNITFNIILEEAHRYVQNDNDIDIIGYNVFDRITKEGRKYGTLLTFITQRPSELSETALSQCANFIVFRIYFPKDLEIVKSMSSNVAPSTIEEIKALNPGTAFAFGTGFKIPTLVNFDLPNPLPESTSINVNGLWY